MSPKVSVIIPVYNVSEYLGQCLDSVLLQTLQDIEVICVDDGSTDDSLDILQGYAMFDERLKIISQENAGAGAARNNGIKHATGEYIICLDSDDFFEPDMLEKMVAKAEEDNSDVVVCDFFLFNNETEQIDTNAKANVLEKFFKKSAFKPTDLNETLFDLNYPAAWNKLIKADLIRKHNITFDEQAKCFEDNLFCSLSLALANKISMLNQACIYYRRNQQTQITSNIKNYFSDLLTVMKNLHNRLIQLNLDTGILSSYIMMVRASMINIMRLGSADKKRENLKLIRQILPNELIEKIFFCPPPRVKVSVIIPVYNAAEFLPECLDSVLGQTLKEIEVICVDDGSTDDSLEILNAYAQKDNRIKVLTQANQRQSIARNTAMEVATGQYVQFLDADDYLEPDACECLYFYSHLHGLDMCQFSAINFHHGSRKEMNNPYHTLSWMTPNTPTVFNADMMSNILPQMAVTACLTFYNRQFLLKKDIHWPTKHLSYEDTPFFIESVLQADRIGAVQIPLYHRRVHPAATTQNMATNFNEYTEIIKYSLNLIKKKTKNEHIFIGYAYTLLQKAWGNFTMLKSDIQIKHASTMFDLTFHIVKKYHLPITGAILTWCPKYLKLKGTKKDKLAFAFYQTWAKCNRAEYTINLIKFVRKPYPSFSILGIPVFKVICTPTPCPQDDDAYHHQLKNAKDIFFKICGLTILKVEKKDFYV